MFPPKGSQPRDQHEVIRTPAQTRPLKCKNHDNKILAGEGNYYISRSVKKHACEIQHGFMWVRNFLCNVVGIDAFARFASYPSNYHLLPLIILFDLKAAFPSVAHDWLFLVLEFSNATRTFINFVKALYHHVKVFVSVSFIPGVPGPRGARRHPRMKET